jgi:hypothetical protein
VVSEVSTGRRFQSLAIFLAGFKMEGLKGLVPRRSKAKVKSQKSKIDVSQKEKGFES